MNVREIAYKYLCGVMLEKQYASLSMRNDQYDLNSQDQALLTQIVYGTLRNYLYVRYNWQKYVSKLPDEKTCVLLDMSTYQLLWLDKVADYAVIDEAVKIVRKNRKGSYAALVNAVLRKVQANGLQKPEDDSLDSISILTSTPLWIIKMWNAHYGRENAEKIAFENLNPSEVTLRVNTLKTNAEEVIESDEQFVRCSEPNSLRYEGNVFSSSAFKNDLVMVQSLSSQKVAGNLAVKKGERVLDMCAAPGTKTVQMAMDSSDQADIYSIDLYPSRVELINKSLNRYGIKCVKTRAYDATKLDEVFEKESFDKILLDAPCSGLGTLKHKPEIKMNLKPEDIDDIVYLQKQLLETAALLLKNGGKLVYSTCTLNRKENDRQIKAFLKEHEEFSLEKEEVIFPFDEGSDGFYIAMLEKNMLE